MPTTTDNSGRAATAGDETTDALGGVYESLRSGEATGEEAVAATIRAFSDLMRAAIPVAVSQPARFVDLTFELAQQAMNFERRLFFEVLAALQRVMTEAWSDLEAEQHFGDSRSPRNNQRSRTRRAA